MYVIRRGRVLQGQARAALAPALQFPKGFAPSLGKPPFLPPSMVTLAGRVLSETVVYRYKQEAKKELLDKVLAYIKTDEKEARRAFETSAGEVIDLLREIEKTLFPS